jgi:hypothetical protein
MTKYKVYYCFSDQVLSSVTVISVKIPTHEWSNQNPNDFVVE